jgi:hypothetical protein
MRSYTQRYLFRMLMQGLIFVRELYCTRAKTFGSDEEFGNRTKFFRYLRDVQGTPDK